MMRRDKDGGGGEKLLIIQSICQTQWRQCYRMAAKATQEQKSKKGQAEHLSGFETLFNY